VRIPCKTGGIHASVFSFYGNLRAFVTAGALPSYGTDSMSIGCEQNALPPGASYHHKPIE
jgi:hypothetical protein